MEKPDYSLVELEKLTASQLFGDPLVRISGVADLASATESDAVFLGNTRHHKTLESCKAGVVFIHPDASRPQNLNYLVCKDPEGAFQQLIRLLSPRYKRPSGFQGIHPTAVIHPSVKLGQDLVIGPHAVIDQGTVIGDRCRIGAGSVIGVDVLMGEECNIHPRVTIADGSRIGNGVIIQPGAVIGSPGFGYRPDSQGRHVRLEHIGHVIIEDDVEIGANTTIDQARLGSTRIGRGTKIDNLVQIAHNVQIGHDNIIVAQAGVAGSSSTGKWVILAGQVGINDHIHLTDHVIVAACSAVSKSIDEAGKYAGIPATPLMEHHKRHAYLKNIEKYIKRIEALERKLNEPKHQN